MNHVMIDIESLGAVPGSVVLSVGLVRFGIDEVSEVSKLVEGGWMENIALASSLNRGMKIEARTWRWWMEQEDSARKALFAPAPISITEACSHLRHHVEFQDFVWAHGSNFDIPLLDGMYDACDERPPWAYRRVRDTRTLFHVVYGRYGAEKWPVADTKDMVNHNPLHDAAVQAVAVQMAFRHMQQQTIELARRTAT